MGEKNTVILKSRVQTPGSVQLVGFLGGMCIVALVFAGVITFAPGKKPSSMLAALPWCWGGAALFGFWAIFIWVRARRVLEVTRGESMSIRVGQSCFRGPFTYDSGYFTIHMKGIPMRHLMLHLYNEAGEHVVGFTEVWGAIHGRPEGWEEHPVAVRGKPGHVWSAAQGRFLRRLRDFLDQQ